MTGRSLCETARTLVRCSATPYRRPLLQRPSLHRFRRPMRCGRALSRRTGPPIFGSQCHWLLSLPRGGRDPLRAGTVMASVTGSQLSPLGAAKLGHEYGSRRGAQFEETEHQVVVERSRRNSLNSTRPPHPQQ